MLQQPVKVGENSYTLTGIAEVICRSIDYKEIDGKSYEHTNINIVKYNYLDEYKKAPDKFDIMKFNFEKIFDKPTVKLHYSKFIRKDHLTNLSVTYSENEYVNIAQHLFNIGAFPKFFEMYSCNLSSYDHKHRSRYITYKSKDTLFYLPLHIYGFNNCLFGTLTINDFLDINFDVLLGDDEPKWVFDRCVLNLFPRKIPSKIPQLMKNKIAIKLLTLKTRNNECTS